jgi:hypothetical protein
MMSLAGNDKQLTSIPQSPVNQNTNNSEEPVVNTTNKGSSSLVNMNDQENTNTSRDSIKNNSRNTVGSQKTRSQGLTCASVDNLCHLRDFRKKSKSKLNCGGGGIEQSEDDEEPMLENKPLNEEMIRVTVINNGTGTSSSKNSSKGSG